MSKEKPQLIGAIYELEDGQFSLWDGIRLTEDDDRIISEILEKYQTDGQSETYSSLKELFKENRKRY